MSETTTTTTGTPVIEGRLAEVLAALNDVHITVQDTDALARKIQQVKAVLDRAKHPVSPMTEVHLTHLERCLNPLLLESIVKNKPLVDEMAMIKQQVGCRIRDAEHIMNFVDEGKGSFLRYMNDKPRDSLDKSHSPTSIDSGICTIANEEPEDLNALVSELQELSFSVTSTFIKEQITKIQQSIPADHRSILFRLALERLEDRCEEVVDQYENYPEYLKSAIEELRAVDSQGVKSLLRGKYTELLRARSQFDVCGVLSFLEDEMFPQHSTYNTLLEKSVKKHCITKSISAAYISEDDLRYIKWMTAAADINGCGALGRLKKANSLLTPWTNEVIADFVACLASEARKLPWVNLPTPLTMADEISAVEVKWIISSYRRKGFGIPAMYAICQLVPVGFSLEKNYSWFSSPEINERREMWLDSGDLRHSSFCDAVVDLLKREDYKPLAANLAQ